VSIVNLQVIAGMKVKSKGGLTQVPKVRSFECDFWPIEPRLASGILKR